MTDRTGLSPSMVVAPFNGIDCHSTVEQIDASWRQRAQERRYEDYFTGHLEPRPLRISHHDYPFLGQHLPLKALINTRVAEEWYSNPTLYCEIMEFHRFGMEMVKPEDVVFDCGAHHGIYSMVFANAVGPNGRVIAFEPVPINAEIARLNVDMNGFSNIDVVPVGIGSREETIRASMQAHSTAANTGDMADATGMKIVTLDSFARFEPAFVKLDIEGAEVDALQGGQELLKQRPRILISVHPPLMAPFKRSPHEIFELVDPRAYQGFCLEGGKPIRPIDDNINMDNFFEVLFIPR